MANRIKPQASAPAEAPVFTPEADVPIAGPNFDNRLASAFDAVVPDKATPAEAPAPTEDTEQVILEQADKAAKAPKAPKVRPISKTHGVAPTHVYGGPRDGAVQIGKAGKSIPTRDTLPKRYLTLMARAEGCDETTGRRVNKDRGPTVGGFAGYTADNTGVTVIYKDGTYRVGEVDPATGLVTVADDLYCKTVYTACGGDEFCEKVVEELGPDFTVGLPPVASKAAKKEKVAA